MWETDGNTTWNGGTLTRAIPWVGVTLRSVTKPLVEHAKVWAHSLSGLKVRAGPCDRKHAGEIRAHSSKLVTGVLV